MGKSEANREKAEWVFREALGGLKLEWIGPEFDFDRDSYKARVQKGKLKGRLLHISVDRLEDKNISAVDIKAELLAEIAQLEAEQKS